MIQMIQSPAPHVFAAPRAPDYTPRSMGGVMDVGNVGRVAAAAGDASRAEPPARPEKRSPPRPEAGADVSRRPVAAERLLAWVDRQRRVLFAVLLVSYLWGFNGQWRVEPDSALYLVIGRNLAEGDGLTYHGKPHNLAFPGLPALIAGTLKLFGTDNLVAAHAVMLLVALCALGLTYRLFLLHADRPTAVAVTLLLGFSRTFYRYAFELMSDMPFLLGVLAFLVGYESLVHRRKGHDPLMPDAP